MTAAFHTPGAAEELIIPDDITTTETLTSDARIPELDERFVND